MSRGCTQCGECLNVCPIYQRFKREEYAPKSKRLLLEPVAAGNSLLPWKDVAKLARLCAGCGRCKDACARKLSAADLLADVRARHPHWTQYMWELWIRHMGPLWPSLGRLAALAPDSVAPKTLESSLAMAKALVNKKNIKPWTKIGKKPDAAINPAPVAVFAGCTANNARPMWRAKAEMMLRSWGYTVLDSSAFTCCGGTLRHAGQYKAMNAMRQQNIVAWKRMGRPRIVSFCASCHHSLAAYAEDSFKDEDATLWQKRCVPLTALLVDAFSEPTPHKPSVYGYHHPCHWGSTGDKDMPFLAGILCGQQLGADVCCGMGGILKMSAPDLSMKIADACIKAFPASTGAVLTGCSGCAMQLAGAAKEDLSVYHWLDVVAV